MKLSDRIRLIISENGLKQKEFAQSIQVTESYISKLLRDESGVSHSTATLIEERYGYSADKDLAAVKAFIDTFNSYKKALGQEKK